MKTKFRYTLIFLIFFSFSNLFSQEIGIQLYSLRNQFNDNIENTIKYTPKQKLHSLYIFV